MELKKRTIKTCSNKDAVARLCDTVERLSDQNAALQKALLEQQTKILDRALSVSEWGLRVAGIEAETARHSERPVNPRPRISDDDIPPPGRLNGDLPDISVGGDPNSIVG